MVNKKGYFYGIIEELDVFIFDEDGLFLSRDDARNAAKDEYGDDPYPGDEFIIFDENKKILETWKWAKTGGWVQKKPKAQKIDPATIEIWWVAVDGKHGIDVEHFTSEYAALEYARDWFADVPSDVVMGFDELWGYETEEGVWQIEWGSFLLTDLVSKEYTG